MAYRTISTFVHEPAGPGAALEAAIALARHEDAHLHVVAPGIDAIDPGFYYAGVHAVALRENLDQARAAAEALREKIEERLDHEEIRWDVESRVVQSPAFADYLAESVRLSDLAVMDAPYGEGRTMDDVIAVESALFGAKVPVLIIPEDGEMDPAPKRIVLAWNESDEALRAARGALPFMQRAELTNIVTVDPPRHGPGRSDPGGALASYLSRHGVNSEISILARTQDDVADILIRRAREIGATLLVMGAYGHTRMREAIIGGATRHMLERAPIPVLMAH